MARQPREWADDLIRQRWPTLGLAILILGLWGVTFRPGTPRVWCTTPHAVGPVGLRIRSGRARICRDLVELRER